MRKSIRIGLFALLALFLIVLFWALRHQVERYGGTGDSNAPAAKLEQNQLAERPPTTPGSVTSQIPPNVANSVPQSKESQIRSGLRNLNHVPIEYFGIVVDQAGNPLPQTHVKWSVAYNNDMVAGHKSGEIVTDATGYFSVSGQTGKSLSVIPERPGYKFIATNGGGIYSLMWPAEQRYVPNPSKPEILTMWRLQGAETLIRMEKMFFFPSGSNAIRVDLTTGQIVLEGGDLEIMIQKTPGEATKSNPQDWSLIVEPLKGGLREVSLTEFRNTLQAPAQGYVPRYESKMDALNPAWTDIVSVFAFVQAREKHVYSKLQLNAYLHAGTHGFGVQINALTNPNSSGNWEEETNMIKTLP